MELGGGKSLGLAMWMCGVWGGEGGWRDAEWQRWPPSRLQVGSFPPLLAIRLSNWGWQLCNGYVRFTAHLWNPDEAPAGLCNPALETPCHITEWDDGA